MGYRLDARVHFPTGQEIFLYSTASQISSVAHTASYKIGSKASFHRSKVARE
jgi:hypothetical protein